MASQSLVNRLIEKTDKLKMNRNDTLSTHYNNGLQHGREIAEGIIEEIQVKDSQLTDLERIKKTLDDIGARTTLVTNGAYTYLVVGRYSGLEGLIAQNHITFFNDGRIVCD